MWRMVAEKALEKLDSPEMKDVNTTIKESLLHFLAKEENDKNNFGDIVWLHEPTYDTPLRMYLPYEVEIQQDDYKLSEEGQLPHISFVA